MAQMDKENELLPRARAGDREAFADLILPHMPMLLAYSRFILGDFHLAQDVIQETAIIAFRNLERFFPDADFASWLKAIVRRRSLAAREKMARGNLLAPEIAKALEEAYADPSPEALSPERQALELCLKALAERDQRSSRLVEEHYFKGVALGDLASLLSLNLNTVKTLLYRARAALQDCVERRLRSAHV